MRLLGRTASNVYPELHSRFKAVTTKWLLVYLAHISNVYPFTEQHDKVIATCLWAAAEFVHVTDHAGVFLEPFRT